MIIGLRLAASLAGLWALSAWAGPPLDAPASKPLMPRDEQMTFRLPKGFVIELVASEPDVVDPVAMAFDEKGRLFVAEMRGYPNGGVGTGKIDSGRIRVLEDCKGNGTFDSSTVFADGLRSPTSVMPYKGGLLVANAPDLIYFEDKSGGGKADKSRVLYTGFDIANIQQLPSGMQWGLDNWIHACAGGAGGTITYPENPKMKETVLRGRGIRFRPDEPGKLEPTSGGGQYGLTQDDWGHWFTATNSQHLRQIVLPDHYLARNPGLPVSEVALDIPDHGAACKVHRISPFESWRVERTKRRKDGPDSKRFPTTELVPGGFITSACSPVVYLASLFPKDYYGSIFVCDPANNLVHRDILEAKGGTTFVARRGEADCEFLASTDTWFRPVCLTLGPDGALYIADFYREVIETPLSLPEDMKKVLPLKSQGRGRIWRVRPEGQYKAPRFDLTQASLSELVQRLDDANAWWRLTAQRLLVEKHDLKAVEPLEKMTRAAKTPQGRVHALRTLEGLDRLAVNTIVSALKDEHPMVRVHALQTAEPHLATSARLRAAVAALVDDESLQVRFQLAFTLGALPEHAPPHLAKLVLRDGEDRWVQAALLSSLHDGAYALLAALAQDQGVRESITRHSLLVQMAALVGGGKNDQDLSRALQLATGDIDWKHPWQAAILDGLAQGLQTRGLTLAESLKKSASIEYRRAMEDKYMAAFAESRRKENSLEVRLRAIGFLGHAPLEKANNYLEHLLRPIWPQEIQAAAVRALARHTDVRVADLLLDAWDSQTPALRRDIAEALLMRKERVESLLTAIEKGKVRAAHLEPTFVEQLQKHPDAKLRARAGKILGAGAAPAREKVVAEYGDVLKMKGERGRGQTIFKAHCAACHRLENEGVEVGADLVSALANKTPEKLLIDILDPSRDVDPRFVEYVVETKDGRLVTGVIAAETSTSVTLRRAEKVEETLLRSQIESINATTKSLMPEGFELRITREEMADLIAYLMAVRAATVRER